MSSTFLALYLLLSFANPMPADQDGDWQLLAQGQLVAISAEKAVYWQKGSNRFFVHVRLRNKTRDAVGVDLSDYHKVVYPNQWGVSQKDHRDAIDEGRVIPKKLDEQSKRKLLIDYADHRLTMINPGATADYYREFNASTIKDVENSQGKYLIISLDGQILATDGKTTETVALEWQKGTEIADTTVVIPFPVAWKGIPGSGLVIKERL